MWFLKGLTKILCFTFYLTKIKNKIEGQRGTCFHSTNHRNKKLTKFKKNCNKMQVQIMGSFLRISYPSLKKGGAHVFKIEQFHSFLMQ